MSGLLFVRKIMRSRQIVAGVAQARIWRCAGVIPLPGGLSAQLAH